MKLDAFLRLRRPNSTKKHINRVVTGTFPQLTIAISITNTIYLFLCFLYQKRFHRSHKDEANV